MEKLATRTALLVSLISFIIGLISDISIVIALLRSGIVFVGVLFIFFMAGMLMRWGVFLMIPRNPIRHGSSETNE